MTMDMITKLNPDQKQAWIAALRSAEYEQIQGRLRTPDGYCCLGVACELAVTAGVIAPATLSDELTSVSAYQYVSHTGVLPASVIIWLGVGFSATVTLPFKDREGDEADLAVLNDSGCTFDQIADIIEYWL